MESRKPIPNARKVATMQYTTLGRSDIKISKLCLNIANGNIALTTKVKLTR